MVCVRGERRLLAGIIQRAMLDASQKGTVGGDIYGSNVRAIEAERWLFEWSKQDAAAPFTFPWVCSHLNLEPDVCKIPIRKCIEALRLEAGPITWKGFGYSYTFIDSLFDVDSASVIPKRRYRGMV